MTTPSSGNMPCIHTEYFSSQLIFQNSIFRKDLSGLTQAQTTNLLDKTLFIVPSKHLLSKVNHLPNVVLEEPPTYTNSSLAYWSHTLSSLAQMQLKLITWPLNKPLSRSPVDILTRGSQSVAPSASHTFRPQSECLAMSEIKCPRAIWSVVCSKAR